MVHPTLKHLAGKLPVATFRFDSLLVKCGLGGASEYAKPDLITLGSVLAFGALSQRQLYGRPKVKDPVEACRLFIQQKGLEGEPMSVKKGRLRWTATFLS
eukprot:Trichotokara_eunicae@DN1164_c0_g1_i1.p1